MRSRPVRSYAAASQSAPMRPVTYCGTLGGEGRRIPECEEFSSPIISERTRPNSCGVRAPSAYGSYVPRSAVQFAPWKLGSAYQRSSSDHACANTTRLSCAKSASSSADSTTGFAAPPASGTVHTRPASR